jgi:hypothetical protein
VNNEPQQPNVDQLYADLEERQRRQLDAERKKRNDSHGDYKKEIPELIDNVASRLTNREGGMLYPLRKSDKKLDFAGKNRFCWHLASQGAPWRDVFLSLDDHVKGKLVQRLDFMDESAVPYEYERESDLDFLKLIRDNLRSILQIEEEKFQPIAGEHTHYTWRK